MSCRSRQTSELAFGGYDSLHRILVHPGPYNENTKVRVDKLKRFYSELPIQSGKNTIVRIINSDFDEQELKKIKEVLLLASIDCTINDVEKKLIEYGFTVFSLDSDELPLIEIFSILTPEYINSGLPIAVPMIHMKYKDATLEIDNQEFKFKKYLDQQNIFYETESDVEIRLREIPNGVMPKIPLSSKWVDWPKTKIIFKAKNKEAQVIGNMNFAVYKFERILEE